MAGGPHPAGLLALNWKFLDEVQIQARCGPRTKNVGQPCFIRLEIDLYDLLFV